MEALEESGQKQKEKRKLHWVNFMVTWSEWTFQSTQEHVVGIQTEVHGLNVLRSEMMTARVCGV